MGSYGLSYKERTGGQCWCGRLLALFLEGEERWWRCPFFYDRRIHKLSAPTAAGPQLAPPKKKRTRRGSAGMFQRTVAG